MFDEDDFAFHIIVSAILIQLASSFSGTNTCTMLLVAEGSSQSNMPESISDVNTVDQISRTQLSNHT